LVASWSFRGSPPKLLSGASVPAAKLPSGVPSSVGLTVKTKLS
jgi:hypothetical protein